MKAGVARARNRITDPALYAKTVASSWSPACAYQTAAKQAVAEPTRSFVHTSSPAYTMGARLPNKPSTDDVPGPNHYGDVSRAIRVLSTYVRVVARRPIPCPLLQYQVCTATHRHHSAPVPSVSRARSAAQLPTKPTVGPGPAYNVRGDSSATPSFSMGKRLKDRRQIATDLGYPVSPAPGGTTRVPSFARDNKQQSKVRRLACRPKSSPPPLPSVLSSLVSLGLSPRFCCVDERV